MYTKTTAIHTFAEFLVDYYLCSSNVFHFCDSLPFDRDGSSNYVTILLKSRKFPIMTISIGVVTNKKMKLKHAVQVGEIAAEVKNYAKSKPGSLYFVDRRKRSS